MACGVIYASSLVFPSCGCSSPAALTLSRNLFASHPAAVLQNGLSGSLSVLLSPSPHTPYQPVTAMSVENRDPGAELRGVCV